MQRTLHKDKSNMERQEIILGTILSGTVKPRAFTSVLTPDMFTGKYFKLAQAIWQQVETYDEIDLVLLAQSTGEQTENLLKYVANSITLKHAALDEFDRFYKESVRKKFVSLLNTCQIALINGDQHGEVMANIETQYKDITSISTFSDKRTEQHIDALKKIERVMEKGSGLAGPDTGYKSFNDMLGGWDKSNLIYLAGRPAMGKTTLAMCLAHSTAKAGGSVGVISIEMDPIQIRQKLLAIETGIAYGDITRGNLSKDQFNEIMKANEQLSELPIHVEQPVSDFEQILSLMYSMNEAFDIDLFIIDYMQLMRKDGFQNNRNGEIGYMSRRLKESAAVERLNACVLCLSQLNRANEHGAKGRPPGLHNLRDSGSLEQDADAVIFVHRPEYYQIYEEDGEPTENLVMAIFEKNRHGETGTVKLWKSANFSQIHEQQHGFTQFPKVDTGGISKSFDGEVPF